MSDHQIFEGFSEEQQEAYAEEARQRYEELIRKWNRERDFGAASGTQIGEIPLAILFAKFLDFAEDHYRHPDGSSTGETDNFKVVIRRARKLYGTLPARDFTPLHFKQVRQKMIDDGLTRTGINAKMRKLRAIFSWGVENMLVAAETCDTLKHVKPLKPGRTAAVEPEEKKPVPEKVFAATMEAFHLQKYRDMAQLQLLLGCRPGELCEMTAGEIEFPDDENSLPIYRPSKHKTAYRQKKRVIPIGPKAQEILSKYIRKDQPKRKLFGMAASAWANAVRLTCKRNKIEHWSPTQLRHSAGTLIRKAFGIEAASTVLGHSNLRTTEIYAEKNLAQAIEIAKQIG